MKEIDQIEVANKYNSLEKIWDPSDTWHFWTYRMITSFIKKIKPHLKDYNQWRILNAGSGGNSYDFNDDNILHVDIAGDKIAHLKNVVVGSIESLPARDNTFELIICVGSVINYCDPIKVIQEFARVLKSKGFLILEFENSNSFELLGKSNFNKKAVMADTFYFGKEKIWYYSSSYIDEILALNNLAITEKDICHIISPFVYRITRNEKIASYFARMDNMLKYIPYINKLCSNTILLIQKR